MEILLELLRLILPMLDFETVSNIATAIVYSELSFCIYLLLNL